jgi:hypothetical protein
MRSDIFEIDAPVAYVNIAKKIDKELTPMTFKVNGIAYPEESGNKSGKLIGKMYEYLAAGTDTYGKVIIEDDVVSLLTKQNDEIARFHTNAIKSVQVGLLRSLSHVASVVAPVNKYWTFVYIQLEETEYYLVTNSATLATQLITGHIFGDIKVEDPLKVADLDATLDERDLTDILNKQFNDMIVGTAYPTMTKLLGSRI